MRRAIRTESQAGRGNGKSPLLTRQVLHFRRGGGPCMRSALIAVSLLLLAVRILAQDASAKQMDVFNYDAQRAAPKGTHRIVFIATKGTHGGRGNHELLAGSLY